MTDILQLTSKEQAILELIEFAPETTLSRIAARSGSKTSSVAYTISKLRNEKIIRERHWIDFFKLGYEEFVIYISLTAAKPENRSAFIREISKEPGLAWLGELVGGFEYGLAILATSASEAANLIDRACNKAKVSTRNRTVTSRTAISFYGRRYLYTKVPSRRPISIRATSNEVAIDEIEHDILGLLAKSPENSIREISRISGHPLATVDRRVKDLKLSGILVASTIDINSELLGYSSHRLLVATGSEASAARDQIQKFCIEQTAVIMLLEGFGSWDFELDLEVRELAQLTALIHGLSAALSAFSPRIEVLGEVKDYKLNLYPF